MNELKILVFIDSDILFSFFAINPDKQKKFEHNGSTGDQELDEILNLISEIESKDERICISEFSILELGCLLNRLNINQKIPQILTKLYMVSDVLPLNEHMIKLAWYVGSNYNLHSGDALHASFCLFSNIDSVILKDKEFYGAFTQLKDDFITHGSKRCVEYFNKISFAQGIPDAIIRKYNNISKLQIRKI